MGIQDLQTFLQSASLDGGAVSVDLLKIARNVTQRHHQPHNSNRKIRPIGNKLKLIVDGENCLSRLYGGFYSDWACGGQWNRMLQFLSLLTRAIERGNIELTVIFNGTIESSRMSQWIEEQADIRHRVGMVLKHINTKGTPPPKIWWVPPTCLRSALRMALRHLGVSVMCTMDDHHQEVIGYCRESGFHGLLADDAEYIAFDPPRYFSSENLKLTYKGSIETKEFMLSELTKSLNLSQEQVCVVAALLGNFLLTENDLQDIHKKINIKPNIDNGLEVNIKTLADYVRSLPPPSSMDKLLVAVFGSLDQPRALKLRQSIQYYLNGTANGFLKYCTQNAHPKEKKTNGNTVPIENNGNIKSEDHDLDTTGFASETIEQEQETLENYKLATANTVLTDFDGLEIGGLSINCPNSDDAGPSSPEQNNSANGTVTCNGAISKNALPNNNTTDSRNNSNSTSVPSSPKHLPDKINGTHLAQPFVSADVLRTASLRHQKGLMASTILHVLSTQEIRLPCLMEDEGNREFPPIHDIYQPLRQRVYAVLFNLHHLRYVHSKKMESGELAENTAQPNIIVKEWIYSRSNPYQNPVEVKAEPLPWAVPTLQRLWFGPSLDDKRRRLRALLSCLNSDTPLILNTAYVPQHMLVMACVLRYIMSQEKPIMRRHELDAFLCHAFNPNLMNPQYLQELTLNMVTSRGVQLASLFMKGVDMALLANDACGAPLPWLMCSPWLYFDGKLFHYTLTRSTHAKNILELCENFIERVVKVERIRKAILEGLDVKFAKVPIPNYAQGGMMRPNLRAQPQCMPMISLPSNRGSAALRQRPIPSRGGQLQVAGVVVGSWGANYGYQSNVRHQQQLMPAGMMAQHPPGVPSFQSQNRSGRNHLGGPSMAYNHYARGNHNHSRGGQFHQRKVNTGGGGPPSYPVNRRNTANKKRNTNKSNKNQIQKGLPLTVKIDNNGEVPVNEVQIEGGNCSNSIPRGKQEDCTNSETCDEQEQHRGQGDAPPNKS